VRCSRVVVASIFRDHGHWPAPLSVEQQVEMVKRHCPEGEAHAEDCPCGRCKIVRCSCCGSPLFVAIPGGVDPCVHAQALVRRVP
jgi:hypothetical protein